MAKATRYLLSATRRLLYSALGKDKKTITFHPSLPLQHKKFHIDRYIEDYELPYMNHDILFNTDRRTNKRIALLMFLITFGVADLLTRVAYD